MRVRRATAALAVGLAILVVCEPVAAETAATTVRVTMTDYRFVLSKTTVGRGTVVFRVVNRGDKPHDFKIKGKKTPIYAAGKGGTLRVTFGAAGRFRFVCTVPGHAALGMKGVLRVR